MKKIITLALGILSLIWVVNVSASTCDNSTIKSLRKELSDVSFNLEYMEEGSNANFNGEEYDVSGKMKLTANIPDGFYAKLVKDSSSLYTLPSGNYLNYIESGVYNVSFYNNDCFEDVIKTFEIMVPYYKSKNQNNDVWFDGTYEYNDSRNYQESTFKLNGTLLIVLEILALVIVVAVVFTLLRKRGRIK